MAARGAVAPLLVVAAALAGCGGSPAAQSSDPDARLERALRRIVSLEAEGERFDLVLAQLARREGISIELDRPALKAAGILPEQPVSIRVRDVPLRSALRLLLLCDDLAFTQHDGNIVVTRRGRELRNLVGRVYPVADLLENHPEFTTERLAAAVRSAIAPETWMASPQGPAVKVLPGALKVLHTPERHAEIAEFLAGIRRLAHPDSAPSAPPPSPAEIAIRKALAKPVVPEYIEVSLRQFARLLADEHGINVVIDEQALRDEGVNPDAPKVTLSLNRDVPLRSALNLVFSQLDCKWTVHDGAVLFTEFDRDPRLRYYATDDLVDAAADFDDGRLRNLIQTAVAPDWWVRVGGPAVLAQVPGGFAVRLHHEGHGQLAQFLKNLRAAREPRVVDYDESNFSPRERAIVSKLDERTEIDFIAIPLEAGLDFLSDLHDVPIYLDRHALVDLGIDGDTPVTLTARNVSLAAGLDLLLQTLDLDWTVENDVLLVTTRDIAETKLQTHVYRVGGLLHPGAGFHGVNLEDMVETIIAPGSWDDWGGVGSVRNVGWREDPLLAPIPANGSSPEPPPHFPVGETGLLVVSQTQRGHAAVRRLLDDLQRATDPRVADYDPAAATPREQRLASILSEPTACDFFETPLEACVQSLSNEHGLPIDINHRDLEGEGIGADLPVTLGLEGVSLASALNRMLHPLGLDWAFEGERVLVTTRDMASVKLTTRVYRVGHLLDPRRDLSASALQNALKSLAPDFAGEEGSSGLGSLWLVDQPGLLIVCHDARGHAAVRDLLDAMAGFCDLSVARAPRPAVVAEGKLRAALKQPAAIADDAVVPLKTALARLLENTDVKNFVVEDRALWDGKQYQEPEVSLALPEMPLADALDVLLDRANLWAARRHGAPRLCWLVRDEALVVTSERIAEREYLEVRFYDPAAGRLDRSEVDFFGKFGAGPGGVVQLPGGWAVLAAPHVQRRLARLRAAAQSTSQ